MSSLKGRRPSPALLISVLALVVALSGIAVASSHIAAKNSVDTKAIQKQAVKNSKIKKETLKGNRIREGAVSASKVKDGAIGDSKLSSAEKSRWAVVTAAGTLVRSKGVASAAPVVGVAGRYNVVFDRDITACAWVATIADPVSTLPVPGEIRLKLATGTTDTVRVRTSNSAGGNNARQFHLFLHC